MKNLEEGKAYFLKIKHCGRELEYKGIILWIRNDRFKIQTEESSRLIFNLKQVFYSKEIDINEIKIPPKIIKIGKPKRIPHHKLKKIEGPEGLD